MNVLDGIAGVEGEGAVVPRRVAWKVYQLTPRAASVRYRCMLPALGLHELGVQSTVFEEGEILVDIERFDALVFVKSFTPSDLVLARRADRLGVPVVLDVCDNIFVPDYTSDAIINPIGRFSAIAHIAETIVVSTEELATRTRNVVGPGAQILTIPDPLETPQAVAQLLAPAAPYRCGRDVVAPRSLAILPRTLLRLAVPSLRRLAKKIDRWGYRGVVYTALKNLAFVPTRARRASRHLRATFRTVQGSFAQTGRPPRTVQRAACEQPAPRAPDPDYPCAARKRVIWFGNHGVDHSAFGIAALESLLPVLADVDRVVPLELCVVSNNSAKFSALARRAPFPCTYARWTPEGIFTHLRSSDVCVIPNPRDEFSICKSANRAALALSMGVPVVATSIPSFLPFAGCTILDDWKEGLLCYLTDDVRRREHLAEARTLLSREYECSVVARRWRALIDTLAQSRVNGTRQSR